MFLFDLGDKLKDVISGFDGVCTARGDYLTGCTQYLLRPKGLNKDKLPWESKWFDEEQLILVKKQDIDLPINGKIRIKERVRNSGPTIAPVRSTGNIR